MRKIRNEEYIREKYWEVGVKSSEEQAICKIKTSSRRLLCCMTLNSRLNSNLTVINIRSKGILFSWPEKESVDSSINIMVPRLTKKR